MTTTLARRIRRIGLLPTTYKTVKEDVLSKNDSGEEVTVTRTKKTPIRHHEQVSNDARVKMISEFRVEAKAKRVLSRSRVSRDKIVATVKALDKKK